MNTIQVKTSQRVEAIDISALVQRELAQRKIESGICLVYSPHTTAGITVNEHADPAVMKDVLAWLGKQAPFEGNYSHLEGNSAAHIKAALVGTSALVPVEAGKLALGRWQGIFLCEFDGPRPRKVYVQVVHD